MNKIFSMAAITFFQGVRTQTFRIIALLFFAFLAVAYFLRVLSIGQTDLMLRSFGLSAIEISGVLLIVFGCINSFYRERETRLQSIHLTYMSHFSYTAGKLLGSVLLTATYIATASAVCSVILWHEKAWSISFLAGSYSIFLKMSIICAFCSLFANLFNSPVFASLMTVFIYLASEYASYPLSMMRSHASAVPTSVSKIVYHLLPNFDKIDMKYIAIYAEKVSGIQLFEVTLYSALYVALVFIPAWRIFVRHEH